MQPRYGHVRGQLSAGTTLICQALIMVFLVNAHSQRLTPVLIGVALATSGLGGAVGAILASRLPEPTQRSWTLIRIFIWIVSAIVVVISGESFICLAFVMGALGFTGALGNIELGTYLMKNTPNGMLSCVTSIGKLISFGACAIGPVLGGVFIQKHKIHDTAAFLLCAIIALSLLSLLLPSPSTDSSRILMIIIFCAILTSAIIGAILRSLTHEDSLWCATTQARGPESGSRGASPATRIDSGRQHMHA